MVVNPVFSKSGKRLNTISKHQTENPNKNVARYCTRNPNLKLVLKAGNFQDARQKARQNFELLRFVIKINGEIKT